MKTPRLSICTALLAVSSCGGGGLTVGGTVTGLAGSVVLQNNGADDITVSTNGGFTFPTGVQEGDDYLVTVRTQPSGQTCRVSNGEGTIAGESVTNVEVDCTEKSWSFPFDLDDFVSPEQGGVSGAPSIAINASGDAVVVWTQSSLGFSQVFKAEYTGGRWAFPANVLDTLSPKGTAASNPRVAINASGDAVVVWTQRSGTGGSDPRQVMVAERTGGVWSAPESTTDKINPGTTDAAFPKVGLDDEGNAVVVWQQNNNTAYQIYKSERRDGTWTHPGSLSSRINPASSAGGADGSATNFTSLAVNRSGCALIAWQAFDGTRMSGYSSRRIGDGEWKHPASLTDTFSLGDQAMSEAPKALLDSACDGLEVWRQSDALNQRIFVRRLSGGSFQEPSDLTDGLSVAGTDVSSGFEAAMNGSGDAVVVWRQFTGAPDNLTRNFRAQFRNGTWTSPDAVTDAFSPKGTVASVLRGDTSNLAVGIDGNAEAAVLWTQLDDADPGVIQLFRSEYRTGAWEDPSDLGDNVSPDAANVSNPAIAVSGNGDSVAAWIQNGQLYLAEYR
jgi:hypothetical protein